MMTWLVTRNFAILEFVLTRSEMAWQSNPGGLFQRVGAVGQGLRASRRLQLRISSRQVLRTADRAPGRIEIIPPFDEIDPPLEFGGHLFFGLRLDDSNGRTLSSAMVAWHIRYFECNSLGSKFLPESEGLRHVRHHFGTARRTIQARAFRNGAPPSSTRFLCMSCHKARTWQDCSGAGGNGARR